MRNDSILTQLDEHLIRLHSLAMTNNGTQQWLTLPRILFWGLVLLLIVLQLRLWVGEGSWADVRRLDGAIERQDQQNHLAAERNKRLRAEVQNLKSGTDAVEERARTQLGMVKDDETFVLIINEEGQ